jgi:hypothetical protein
MLEPVRAEPEVLFETGPESLPHSIAGVPGRTPDTPDGHLRRIFPMTMDVS